MPTSKANTKAVAEQARFPILIVDDDVELALNLQDILEEEGYTVTIARDGQSALKLCRDGNFALTIIDIKLPDFDGIELVEQLGDNAQCPETILITGFASVDSAIAAVRQRKIIAYETKPLNMELLLSFVRQVYERKRAEEVLRQSEAQLRLILSHIPCFLWTTDSKLIMTSRLGTEPSAWRRQPDQVVGMTLEEYFNTKDLDFPPILGHQRALRGIPSTYEVVAGERTLYCYVEPLRDKQKIIGVIGIALDITERKQSEEDHKELSRRLVEIQEEERRTIARELHDEIGQLLTALKIMLSRAAAAGSGNGTKIDEAQALVNELMMQVRDMSLDLRPSMLDDLGLLPTLLWHFGRYTASTQIQVNFQHSGLDRRFPEDVTTAAYRMVQEALTNVARHAGVDEATVRVWADNNTLSLTVEDKGTGFDSLTSGRHGGLNGMKERAILLGGQLTIQSAPGKGTTIKAELPIPKASGAGTKETGYGDKHSAGR